MSLTHSYDHALHLYPLPDVVVLADRYSGYSQQYQTSHCINPGSFADAEYSFTVYWPRTGLIQPSRVTFADDE